MGKIACLAIDDAQVKVSLCICNTVIGSYDV